MKKLLFSSLFMLFCITLIWGQPNNSTKVADDLSLDGKWILQKLNGSDVGDSSNLKIIPYLVFNMESNNITGFTGCNTITGRANTPGDEIKFNDMSVTKMECPDAKYEMDIVNMVFYNGPLKYKIDNGNLSIFKEVVELMVFKKSN